MTESLMHLIQSDTLQMLAGFLLFLFVVWQIGKWLKKQGAGKERPIPEIPPLPSLHLPEQSRQVGESARTFTISGKDKPTLPEIPLSEAQRRRAQEFLSAKEKQ